MKQQPMTVERAEAAQARLRDEVGPSTDGVLWGLAIFALVAFLLSKLASLDRSNGKPR